MRPPRFNRGRLYVCSNRTGIPKPAFTKNAPYGGERGLAEKYGKAAGLFRPDKQFLPAVVSEQAAFGESAFPEGALSKPLPKTAVSLQSFKKSQPLNRRLIRIV